MRRHCSQSLLCAGQQLRSVSCLYLDVHLIHSHMVHLFNGHLAENILTKQIFLIKSICQEFPFSTPTHRGLFFFLIFEAVSQDSHRSLSEQITRRTNIVIGDFFFFFFCCLFFVACSATVTSRDSLPVVSFKEKRRTVQVLNVAEVRRECAWRCVPARCQRGGILKQQSLSSSSVILSLHSQMSEFCLPLSFFLLQPSHFGSCDRRHNKNTNLCLLMSVLGDPAIWECLNQRTVLN